MADFLGVNKSAHHQSQSSSNHLSNPFNCDGMPQDDRDCSDALFSTNSLDPMQSANFNMNIYDQFQQENANSLQSLTLSMGRSSTSTSVGAANMNICEASGDTLTTTNDGDIATAIVPANEATPRRTIDTFGQRTSIYRGVTRCVYLYICIVTFHFL